MCYAMAGHNTVRGPALAPSPLGAPLAQTVDSVQSQRSRRPGRSDPTYMESGAAERRAKAVAAEGRLR